MNEHELDDALQPEREALHRMIQTWKRCQKHLLEMTPCPEQSDLIEMLSLAGDYIHDLAADLVYDGDDDDDAAIIRKFEEIENMELHPKAIT